MTLTLPVFLAAVVALVFVWVSLDWLFGALRHWHETSRLRKNFWQCHLCGKHYREQNQPKTSECPSCSGKNMRGGHRKLG